MKRVEQEWYILLYFNSHVRSYQSYRDPLILLVQSSKEGKCEKCMMQNQYCICESIQTIRNKSEDELNRWNMRFVVWMHHKAGAKTLVVPLHVNVV